MQLLSDIKTECYIVAYSLISPNVKIKVFLQNSDKSRGKGALVETVPCGSSCLKVLQRYFTVVDLKNPLF